MLEKIRQEIIETVLGWRGWKIIGAPEKVTLFSAEGTPSDGVLAEVNTTWDYSVIDEALAKELGLLGDELVVEEVEVPALGTQKQRLVMVTFILGGRQKRSRWVVVDRGKSSLPVAIGRRDLAGFLVQISEIV